MRSRRLSKNKGESHSNGNHRGGEGWEPKMIQYDYHLTASNEGNSGYLLLSIQRL